MNKTTKIIIGIIVAIIIIGGVWYGVSKKPTTPTTKEPIKIGVILPLTGNAAAYGNQIKKGIDLALQEIKDSQINILYEDSKCDPKEGISAYNKLVNIERVKIIIGDFCSSVVLAIGPLAEQNHILLITPGAAARQISQLGDYIFRNHVTMGQKTGTLAQFASKKFRKVAIIYNSSNDAFVDGMNVFKELYTKQPNNEIVAIEAFKTGDSDFRSQLSKIKNKNPEAIYIGSLASELGLIVKQIKELNINAQILTDDGVLDPQFLKNTGNLSEGIIFGTTNFDKSFAPDFWNNYLSSFKEEPTIFSAQGYDTLKIFYSIIKDKCQNGDPTCIKDELYKIKNYPGASGKTSFDENGDALKEIIIKTIKNGQFVPYEK
jgi:branched-chain amino acid transport system substrate-binding protein